MFKQSVAVVRFALPRIRTSALLRWRSAPTAFRSRLLPVGIARLMAFCLLWPQHLFYLRLLSTAILILSLFLLLDHTDSIFDLCQRLLHYTNKHFVQLPVFLPRICTWPWQTVAARRLSCVVLFVLIHIAAVKCLQQWKAFQMNIISKQVYTSTINCHTLSRFAMVLLIILVSILNCVY